MELTLGQLVYKKRKYGLTEEEDRRRLELEREKRKNRTPEEKKKLYLKNKERHRAQKADPKSFGIKECRALRDRAKYRGLEFNLTPQYLQKLFDNCNGKCSETGLPFDMEMGKGKNRNPHRPSVDRIDSNKGYVKRNIQIVLALVNTMKMDYTPDIIYPVIQAWSKRIEEKKAP
jgi:hypothetical protein